MSLYSAHRRPSWRFVLLNRADEPLRELDEVVGGDCEIVARSRLGLSGNVQLLHVGSALDWRNERMQAIYDPGITGVEPWAVGTFLFSSPEEFYSEAGLEYEVVLSSKLQLLDVSVLRSTFSLPAGANIVAAVTDLIRSVGETRVASTPSDRVLRSGMVWEPGESKLTIINDLLTAINYWSLWVDGAGQFRVEPYVAPGDRAVRHEFVQGPGAIHAAEWSRSRDEASIPNVVVVTSQGTDDEEGFVGVAVNDDPADPYSIVNSVEIAFTDEVSDLESEAQAVARAERLLVEKRSAIGKIFARYVPIPADPNDAVLLRDQSYEGVATVQRVAYSFSPGAWCEAEWREVL